jgi:putative hydrolase of the HAD superfamily
VVRAVIFDFYGTLVTEREGEIESDLAILQRYGYDPAALERLRWIDPVTTLDHAEFSESRAAYVAWQRRQWLAHLRRAGVAEEHLELLVDHAAARSGARELDVFPDAVATLGALREAGIRTAVCSNWGWDLAEAISACGLTGLIDVQVTSAQAGYRKPHPRIFELALERLDVPAGEVMFVGDNWSADVEGAKSAGMRVLHVVRPGVAATGAVQPVPDGVLRIDGLGELVALATSPGR